MLDSAASIGVETRKLHQPVRPFGRSGRTQGDSHGALRNLGYGGSRRPLLAGCSPKPEETEPAPSATSEATEPAAPDHSASGADHAGPSGGVGATATATLQPADASSGISGTVTFTQELGGVRVVADISGLTKGNHGFHIHQNGECTPPFTSAGDHLNPYNIEHSCPPEQLRHLGTSAASRPARTARPTTTRSSTRSASSTPTTRSPARRFSCMPDRTTAKPSRPAARATVSPAALSPRLISRLSHRGRPPAGSGICLEPSDA